MVPEATAAIILGLSKSTLAVMAIDNEIPFVQVYNRRFYVIESLQKWIRSRETPASSSAATGEVTHVS